MADPLFTSMAVLFFIQRSMVAASADFNLPIKQLKRRF